MWFVQLRHRISLEGTSFVLDEDMNYEQVERWLHRVYPEHIIILLIAVYGWLGEHKP